MKPIELLPKIEKRLYIRGYQAEQRLLNKYSKQDNMVAYVQNCLGTIFVIQTAKGFMGFILTEKNFRGYTLFRIGLRESQKLLTHNCEKDRLHIVDENMWKRFENKVALMELDEKEKSKDFNYSQDYWNEN
jgi:hypothetical protein